MKDALFVVDDFAPEGTTAEIGKLHGKAARLLRAQGNRSSRQRMRADTSLRPPKPPRGFLLSSGEDVPRGQSVRARMLALELAPGDIDPRALSECQAAAGAGHYAQAMAGFLARIAPHYDEVLQRLHTLVPRLRDEAARTVEGSHTRIPTTVAELGAGWRVFLDTLERPGVIAEPQAEDPWNDAWAALLRAGADQCAHQVASDPACRFLELVASALGSGAAHGRRGRIGAP